MKFLVDAQLPARHSGALVAAGYDAIHTGELPDGNQTTDGRIAEVADRDDRVVVTKDRDFRDGHLLSGMPRRLLVIAPGNITNAALLALVETHLEVIVEALDDATSSSSPRAHWSSTSETPARSRPPAEVSAHVTPRAVTAVVVNPAH